MAKCDACFIAFTTALSSGRRTVLTVVPTALHGAQEKFMTHASALQNQFKDRICRYLLR